MTNVPDADPPGLLALTGALVLINVPDPEPLLELPALPPPAFTGALVLISEP